MCAQRGRSRAMVWTHSSKHVMMMMRRRRRRRKRRRRRRRIGAG